MKLIIQIPCHNEAETLPMTLKDLPTEIPGIDVIELLIIDDGSSDETVHVAIENDVDHIIKLRHHVGLAGAFVAGLEACLAEEADIIVNTDADNQYKGEDIPRLIEPLLNNQADIVVGDRGVSTLRTFSTSKRILQRFGSWVIQRASGVPTPDATSGFRAYTQDAAMRTIVLSEYSYTLETLIQAGATGLAVEYVPVKTNPQTRPSRLIRSLPQYMTHSSSTIVRAYTMYKPLRVFTAIGSLLLFGGLVLGVRFLYFFFSGQGAGHLQSLILAAVLLIVGFQIMLIGLVADLIGFNRKILEETLYRIRKLERSSDPQKHFEDKQSIS
ncbi:MAG: glycosyltransferase [Anaerolineales bacterium]|nr:glycosyltransferase [Anaerolineales bacterium]